MQIWRVGEYWVNIQVLKVHSKKLNKNSNHNIGKNDLTIYLLTAVYFELVVSWIKFCDGKKLFNNGLFIISLNTSLHPYFKSRWQNSWYDIWIFATLCHKMSIFIVEYSDKTWLCANQSCENIPQRKWLYHQVIRRSLFEYHCYSSKSTSHTWLTFQTGPALSHHPADFDFLKTYCICIMTRGGINGEI